jgi:hypothetical protein
MGSISVIRSLRCAGNPAAGRERERRMGGQSGQSKTESAESKTENAEFSYFGVSVISARALSEGFK